MNYFLNSILFLIFGQGTTYYLVFRYDMNIGPRDVKSGVLFVYRLTVIWPSQVSFDLDHWSTYI